MEQEIIYESSTNRRTRPQFVSQSVSKGLSFGSCLAIVISYTAWQSIPWAIFHGMLSWVYVIYYIFMY